MPSVSAIASKLAGVKPGPSSGLCSEEAWADFCELYLTTKQWSVGKCHRHIRAAADIEGWAWPKIRAIELRVKKEIPEATKCLKRLGPKEHHRRFIAPYQQDPEAYDVGERWESDHSMLDFFARVHRGGKWVPRRLWVTAWMDWRSRIIAGWHISESPNTSTIKLALLRALKDGLSVPQRAWLDHGKDYESAALYGLTKKEKQRIKQAGEWWMNSAQGHGLLGRLGIEPHFALPYNHNGKARIERMFGSMHMEHDREYKSWCGSKKDTVDPDALKAAVHDVMSLPTIDEVRERVASWADWYNHTKDHNVEDLDADRETGEALSRIEHYTANLPAERRLSDPNVLILLEREWSRPLKVGKRGIGIKFGGGTTHYGDVAPELDHYKGTDRTVFVTYDPEDTGEISVFDGDYRFICRATENDSFGGVGKISKDARILAHQQRSSQRKRARDWAPAHTISGTIHERSIAAQREIEVNATKARLAEQGIDTTDMPPLRPVFTPLDGQHDEIGRASCRERV